MDDSIVDLLQEIGLTEYQSRAYVAAVSLGTARLSALSDESDIPQQRIYDVVDDLKKLGLLEIHEGSGGKEAVAVPPEVGLTELKEQRLDRFESNVDTAIADLGQRFDEVDTSMGFVTVVNHESSTRRHIRDAVESAEWWLFLSLPMDWYADLRGDIRSALERGVTVRLLVQADDRATVEDAAFPDGLVVRHRPSADLVVAADREYGVFRGLASPAVTRPSLITRDESMVEMFQRYSEQFWMGSKRIQTEFSYPRRYLTPWRAIIDHIDLMGSQQGEPEQSDGQEPQVSGDISVYVEGHNTDTGRSGTWEGQVVDYVFESSLDAEETFVLPEVARLVVETDDGQVTVGGWDAILEDVAAHGLEIRRP
ncbi:TrmB family transcriptional regulator [Halostella sp. PRR32]|uniref:TrmB family transcriptional regulator n=1 Tax=Halostella sp. PRR32 TaxID=3098147 RepID=UPI002B1DCBD7|nr:TrmB family transcriptional regulator [Halostella sp. PRR32]